MSTETPTPEPTTSSETAKPTLKERMRRSRMPRVRRPRREDRDHGLDRTRLRRARMIIFGILAVPMLVLALLAGKFVSMPLTQAWHNAAYDAGDHPTAIERLAPVWVVNWFEPYLPHLSKGTDLLQEGKDAEAEAELRRSLELWDEGKDLNQPQHANCKIRNNLAIAIERQADGIEDPGERADRLFEAEEILAPCAGGGGGGEDEGDGQGGEGEGQPQEGEGNEDSEATEGNGDRIQEKRREADEEAGNDPDARGGSEGQEEGGNQAPPAGDPKRNDPEGDGPEEEAPEDGGDDGGDPKEDELEERNRDAQGGEGEDQGGSDQDPEKPW